MLINSSEEYGDIKDALVILLPLFCCVETKAQRG